MQSLQREGERPPAVGLSAVRRRVRTDAEPRSRPGRPGRHQGDGVQGHGDGRGRSGRHAEEVRQGHLGQELVRPHASRSRHGDADRQRHHQEKDIGERKGEAEGPHAAQHREIDHQPGGERQQEAHGQLLATPHHGEPGGEGLHQVDGAPHRPRPRAGVEAVQDGHHLVRHGDQQHHEGPADQDEARRGDHPPAQEEGRLAGRRPALRPG